MNALLNSPQCHYHRPITICRQSVIDQRARAGLGDIGAWICETAALGRRAEINRAFDHDHRGGVMLFNSLISLPSIPEETIAVHGINGTTWTSNAPR